MKFKKVFRGYDPTEVDRHLTETALKEQQIRAGQKERIDELLEENSALRKLVAKYQSDEKAILNALIESQKSAEATCVAAKEYSESVVQRAKIFCASWQAYAQTLVAALSDEEVQQLNFLQRKIENIVYGYEGKDVKEVAATNPISRIEGAAEQAIDLKELITPTQSLEEICAELGLKK